MISDSGLRPVIFGNIDARVSIFIMIWAMHMSWITFKVAIAAIVLFSILAWFGITLPSLWGWISYRISGKTGQVSTSAWRGFRRARL